MRSTLPRQLGSNGAQVSAQLGQVPPFSPKDSQERVFAHQGVTLTGKSLDQRGFSAAVWSQDSDMFLLPNPQRNVVKHDGITAGYRNIFHVNK
jgi:hypothetical protein